MGSATGKEGAKEEQGSEEEQAQQQQQHQAPGGVRAAGEGAAEPAPAPAAGARYSSFLAKAGFTPPSSSSPGERPGKPTDAAAAMQRLQFIDKQEQEQEEQEEEEEEEEEKEDPVAAEELRKAVAKAVAAARKAHAAQHRQARQQWRSPMDRAADAATMQSEIADNASKLQATLQQQWRRRDAGAWPLHAAPLPRTAARGAAWPADAQRAGLSASLAAAAVHEAPGADAAGPARPAPAPRPAAPQALEATRDVASTAGGRAQALQAWVVPAHARVPEYRAWTHVRSNTLALEVGQKMFYTDENGETVPMVDGEETPQHRDLRILCGIDRRRQEAAIAEALRVCGKAPPVFAALAAKLGASAEAIGRRAQQLGLLPGGEQERPAPRWEDKAEDCDALEADIYASWCRRCRSFGCRIHEGSHMRPVCGPVSEQPRAPAFKPGAGAGGSGSAKRASAGSDGAGKSTAAAAALAAAANVPARRRSGAGPSSPPPPAASEEVWRQLRTLGIVGATPRGGATAAAGRGGGRGGRKRRKVVAVTGARRQPLAAYERAKRKDVRLEPQYFPCSCEGPCIRDCPCMGDAMFCEKFCGCPPECRNRAVTNACRPRPSARSQDCRPTVYGTQRQGWQCNNMRVRLGQKKRVLMGLSNGWGAFLGQPATKDDFVGEYTGELVGDDEADRRGTCYDRDDNSYLFETNQTWVIDARRVGNKLRFANHSTEANCRAQVLLVDGDHRVAILASRDIVPGEELFYDYNYDKRVAPEWAVQMRERGDREAGDGAARKGASRKAAR
eukprot:scaffold21.g2203.t1